MEDAAIAGKKARRVDRGGQMRVACVALVRTRLP